jgi:Flp pilus assembly pilin Flp
VSNSNCDRASEKSAASKTSRFLVSDRMAVTALEYGIIASILGLVLVGIFTAFGKTLTTLFSHVATSI